MLHRVSRSATKLRYNYPLPAFSRLLLPPTRFFRLLPSISLRTFLTAGSLPLLIHYLVSFLYHVSLLPLLPALPFYLSFSSLTISFPSFTHYLLPSLYISLSFLPHTPFLSFPLIPFLLLFPSSLSIHSLLPFPLFTLSSSPSPYSSCPQPRSPPPTPDSLPHPTALTPPPPPDLLSPSANLSLVFLYIAEFPVHPREILIFNYPFPLFLPKPPRCQEWVIVGHKMADNPRERNARQR